jgi:hypothetical protein
MMFERNKTYNDVISIERVDFSELSAYPLGTFIKIADNTKIPRLNNNNRPFGSSDLPMPINPNNNIGSVRKLEDYTYYFINTDNNGNCVDLSSSWTPAVRKKVRNIIDPVIPIINNVPSTIINNIPIPGLDGKDGRDGIDGRDGGSGPAGPAGPALPAHPARSLRADHRPDRRHPDLPQDGR